MSDASPETRALSRGCFHKFAGHWDERASVLKETLDSAVQRALARDSQQNSSASSLKKQKPTAEKRRAASGKRDQESIKVRIQQAQAQRVSVFGQDAPAQQIEIVTEHRLPVRVPLTDGKDLSTTAAPALRIPVEREETNSLIAGAERVLAPPTTPHNNHHHLHHHHNSHKTLTIGEPSSSAQQSEVAPTPPPSAHLKAKRIRLARIPPHKTEAHDSRSGLKQQHQPQHHPPATATPTARRTKASRVLSTPPARRIAAPIIADWESESGHLTEPIPMLLIKRQEKEEEPICGTPHAAPPFSPFDECPHFFLQWRAV